MNKIGILVFSVLLAAPGVVSARDHVERYYQDIWCDNVGGETEYILPDRTRVDCLTDEHAIEFDFADKWAEAIGQSLYYASQTGRKPGIVLIMERPKNELRYVERVFNALNAFGLDVDLWFATR